jgi:hypothetical protein
MVTALTLPMAIFMFREGLRACQKLFEVIAALVGWPML